MSVSLPSTQQVAPGQQYQTSYEVCLYGSVTGADAFRSVFDRLTLKTETGSSRLHVRELVFEAATANPTSMMMMSAVDDPPTLVCRKDLLTGGNRGGWILSTHGRPEPPRLQPLAIVRPSVYSKATGDAAGCASTLGYRLKSEHYKRGFVFTSGMVAISVYQIDIINPETKKPEKAPEGSIWMIEAKTPSTHGALAKELQALTEVRELLRGLVDLDRNNFVSHI
ncbi:hypothetical protein FRB94_007105 [Tulasnella sp. JGI-2019a]|nr:hypothetical protein FRB94_007105 [Tulasnella sp. JGI-2019a]